MPEIPMMAIMAVAVRPARCCSSIASLQLVQLAAAVNERVAKSGCQWRIFANPAGTDVHRVTGYVQDIMIILVSPATAAEVNAITVINPKTRTIICHIRAGCDDAFGATACH